MELVIVVGFGYDNLVSTRKDISMVLNRYPNAQHITMSDCEKGHYVSSLEDIRRIMSSYSNDILLHENILIYYSGHGAEDMIELPDNKMINHMDFRDMLLSYTRKDSKILIVIDCCYAGNFGFPFTFYNKKFRYDKSARLIDRDVMCITSSQKNQKSYADSKGSYFTKYLLQALNTSGFSIENIITYTEERLLIKTSQRIGVHSTFNRIPVMWSWVVTDHKIQCHLNSEYISI